MGGLLAHCKAKQIYCYRVAVKESTAFTVRPNKNGQLSSKDPNSPIAFRDGFLKAAFVVRASRCMILFGLVGGEVMR